MMCGACSGLKKQQLRCERAHEHKEICAQPQSTAAPEATHSASLMVWQMERMAALRTTYYVDTELAMLVKLMYDGQGDVSNPLRIIRGESSQCRIEVAMAGEELPAVHRSSQPTPTQPET